MQRIHSSGFGVLGVVVIIFVMLAVGGIGYAVLGGKGKSTDDTTSVAPKPTAAHTAAEGTAAVQKTYADYLAALQSQPSTDGRLKALDAIKQDLTSSMYTVVQKDESTSKRDEVGCVASPRSYTAKLAMDNGNNAVVAVDAKGDNNKDLGVLEVAVNLDSLQIMSVTCP